MAGEHVPEHADRFRLTSEEGDGRMVLRVEGRLSPASLELLEAACGEVLARGDVAVVDLSGLRSLPDAAADQLAGLARSGVELTGASGFVAALLRAGR
jgi:anti-anti-sigma regulatory factor